MDVIEIDRDTCDACPHDAHVQASIYVDHEDWPTPMAYCNHHGTKYLPELHRIGAKVINMSHSDHDDT